MRHPDTITAYDVASVTIHWMARQWERASPTVAARLRAIADRLSDRASALRRAHYESEQVYDPLDPDGDEPTNPRIEPVTQPHFVVPEALRSPEALGETPEGTRLYGIPAPDPTPPYPSPPPPPVPEE